MSENEIEVQVVEVKNSKVRQIATVVGATATYALVASSAHAVPIEIPAMTEVVTMITGMVAVVASVGMAVLSVYATARVFKWVKAAF